VPPQTNHPDFIVDRYKLVRSQRLKLTIDPAVVARNMYNGVTSGAGEFIYCELMKYNENFVEEIKDSKDIKSLLKIWEQMKEKAFFKHNFEMQEFEKNIEEFKKLDLQKQKKLLFDILDKNQLYVNYSEVEDKKFKIEKNDKEMSKNFYIK
jgi:adenine-specific DNA-methyltransferase